MEQIQLWSPDTCGCVFHQAVDPDTGIVRFISRDEAVEIHQKLYEANPGGIMNPSANPQPQSCSSDSDCTCIMHSAKKGFLTNEDAYAAATEDNQLKNKVFATLEKEHDISRENYQWAYTEDRVLS